MSEYTGGTWKVADRAYSDHWRGDGTEVLSEYGRIADTSANGLRNHAEAQANARLISAAPDMLEVLRLVAEFFADTDAPIGKAAHAAINKALLPEGVSKL